jgi:hypothetical protein
MIWAVDIPIGWRVCVQPATDRPFDREFRPKPRYIVFPSQDEAEKQRQRAHFGEHAAIHIEPVFAPPATRERERKAMQESLAAAGWPIQMRPPRPGMPDRKRRRK